MNRPILTVIPLLGLLACDSAPTEGKPAAPKAAAAAKPATKAADKAPDVKAPEAKADKPAQPAAAEKKPEPKLTEFAPMPADATLLMAEMLQGQLRVPKGAKLGRNINGWQEISTGKDFTMVVRESFDAVDKAKADLGEVKYVVEEPDTLVYEKDGAFGFVQRVEAKGPEVLEGEADRTYECRAGAAMDWAVSKKPKLFPREQVDIMVAACRTLEIPPLEE